MSTDSIGPGSPTLRLADAGPLGNLPRLDAREARLDARLARISGPGTLLSTLFEPIGGAIEFGPPEILWRASGLSRPGAIARISWTRRKTRIGLGIETAPAHAIVDRLLGFDRLEGEEHLQLTPVEFGILLFVVEEILGRLSESPGPIGPWDLGIERIGPDPFDPEGLGGVVTIRWPVSIGRSNGSVRLWIPTSLVDAWLAAPPPRPAGDRLDPEKVPGLSSVWVAEAGKATLTRGLSRLRVGGILPIDGAPLGGTVASPTGAIELTLRVADATLSFDASPAPSSGGGRLVVSSPIRQRPSPREPISVEPAPEPGSIAGPNRPSVDVPVTLVVELGRVNLTLARLADLKPGDVLELGRHAREPIELTSGGRLVARGELVQIDTELGVRVTNLFV